MQELAKRLKSDEKKAPRESTRGPEHEASPQAHWLAMEELRERLNAEMEEFRQTPSGNIALFNDLLGRLGEVEAELDVLSLALPDLPQHAQAEEIFAIWKGLLDVHGKEIEAGTDLSLTEAENRAVARAQELAIGLQKNFPLLLFSHASEDTHPLVMNEVLDPAASTVGSPVYAKAIERCDSERQLGAFSRAARTRLQGIAQATNAWEQKRENEKTFLKNLTQLSETDPLAAAGLMASSKQWISSEHQFEIEKNIKEGLLAEFQKAISHSLREGMSFYMNKLAHWKHEVLRESFDYVSSVAFRKLHDMAKVEAREELALKGMQEEDDDKMWAKAWHRKIYLKLEEAPVSLAKLMINRGEYPLGTNLAWSEAERRGVYREAIELKGWEGVMELVPKDLDVFLMSGNDLPPMSASVQRDLLDRAVKQGTLLRELAKHLPIVSEWTELTSPEAHALLAHGLKILPDIPSDTIQHLFERFPPTSEQQSSLVKELIGKRTSNYTKLLPFLEYFSSSDTRSLLEQLQKTDQANPYVLSGIALRPIVGQEVLISQEEQEAEATVRASEGHARKIGELVRELSANTADELREKEKQEAILQKPFSLAGKIGKGESGAEVMMFQDTERLGVYKPCSSEPGAKEGTTQLRYGIPPGKSAAREWLAAQIDKVFQFNLVPATILRNGPAGIGSLQMWERGTPGELAGHIDSIYLMVIALFDALIQNCDRHKGNYLIDKDEKTGKIRIKAIDHGCILSSLTTKADGLRSEPIQQVGTDVPIPLELRQKIRTFRQNTALQTALKEAFDFALEEASDGIWDHFMERVIALDPEDEQVPSYLPKPAWRNREDLKNIV